MQCSACPSAHESPRASCLTRFLVHPQLAGLTAPVAPAPLNSFSAVPGYGAPGHMPMAYPPLQPQLQPAPFPTQTAYPMQSMNSPLLSGGSSSASVHSYMSPPEDASVYAGRKDSVSSSVSDEQKTKICKADAHKASEMRSRNKYVVGERNKLSAWG